MVSPKKLADYLQVDQKSLGDFLELFGMERSDLPLIGVTEIEIPSFDISSKVYFLVYKNQGKMDYKGFRMNDAARELRGYDHLNYYDGEISTKITTGVLLPIGDMKYRALNEKERENIERILESS